MSEEEEGSQQSQEPVPLDDTRFEVKWRKKEGAAPAATAGEASEAPPAEASQQELARNLAEAEERIRTLQDRWQRAAADLANLRRRTEQDKDDVEKFASMLLVAELLPVLDNFERALQTVPENLVMLTWIQGVMLIERQLRAILEHRGLAPIEAQGQRFNPSLHEAIAEQETADVAPDTITTVFQKGYTMHGRVIRPALVELARQPATAPETVEPGSSEAAHEQVDPESIAEDAATENPGP